MTWLTDGLLAAVDRAAEAHTHRKLAGAYLYMDQFEDASTHLREALELYEQLEDR